MTGFSETATGCRVTIPAVLEAIDTADEQITQYLQEHKTPVDLFAMRILLREAALNAVIHGSGKDASKQVLVEIRMDSNTVTLIVEDSGGGFATANVAPVDVLGDGGRGIALMHIYANSVVYNESGNRVELTRALNTEDAGETSAMASEGGHLQ